MHSGHRDGATGQMTRVAKLPAIMPRWFAIFFCSIALCCTGTLTFAQLASAAPQLMAQAVSDATPDAAEVPDSPNAPDGQTLPAPAEQAQPDMPFDLPELFDSRLAALPLGASSVAPPRLALAALQPPFIEGPQRPPRGFSAV